MGQLKVWALQGEAEAVTIPGDVIYTISGRNADRFHEICTKEGCDPSPLENGSFTVFKSSLNVSDSVVLQAMRKRLAEATSPTAARSP